MSCLLEARRLGNARRAGCLRASRLVEKGVRSLFLAAERSSGSHKAQMRKVIPIESRSRVSNRAPFTSACAPIMKSGRIRAARAASTAITKKGAAGRVDRGARIGVEPNLCFPQCRPQQLLIIERRRQLGGDDVVDQHRSCLQARARRRADSSPCFAPQTTHRARHSCRPGLHRRITDPHEYGAGIRRRRAHRQALDATAQTCHHRVGRLLHQHQLAPLVAKLHLRSAV